MAEGWLTGKRALIVGAGSGIGRGVVDAFVAEGAKVTGVDLDPAKCEALTAAQPDVLVLAGDATSRAVNDEAVRAAVERFGGLDVVVHCVGIFDFYRGIRDIDPSELEDAFEEIQRVNVLSCLHAVGAAEDELRRSRGAIVLTGSTSSFQPGRGGVLYVASKFAIRGLVASLSHELAPEIRVNGVAPGGTLGTDLRGPRAFDLADSRLNDDTGRSDAMKARTGLQVAMDAIDHAGSYVFLASDRARGTTGTIVHSDGGVGIYA